MVRTTLETLDTKVIKRGRGRPRKNLVNTNKTKMKKLNIR